MRNRALAAAALLAALAMGATPAHAAQTQTTTSTPIKHLVVIFQENVSFDHYFGTYPHAANPTGEPSFTPAPGTAGVNGLSDQLLTDNPNKSNPQRLDRSQALTCDQDHGYTAEQKAFDAGAMDAFVQNTGREKTALQCTGQETGVSPDYAVMDYYDGNTVTGLWNYAQRFALSDNSYGTTFGPSSPGAVNVMAGNTYGAICGPSRAVYHAPACAAGSLGGSVAGQAAPQGEGTMYSDADPYYDVCSYTEDKGSAAGTIQMGGANVATCSTRRESHGAGSRAASRAQATSLASQRATTPKKCAPARIRTWAVIRYATTCPITSRSSTTPRPPTRNTCRRARWRRSATQTRQTISTTSATSGRPPTAAICPPCHI